MVGSDVGGWTGGATPELFARWVEVGAISPFFRGHVQTGAIDQEPWAFGVEVEEISRLVIGDRYRLLPYWYSLLREASQTGIPPLRPMVLEFQDDEAARTLSYQALVGPYLLFAPVLDAGSGSLELYLPEGRWMEFHSGALVDGPAQVQVSTTLQALPVFMREGAIVPRMQPVEWSDQAPISSLQLEVMPGAEPTSFTLYEDDGDSLDYLSGSYSEVTYTAKRTAAGAVLSAGPRAGSWVPPPRRLVVRLRRVDHVPTDVTFSGTSLPKTLTPAAFEGASAGWYYDASDLALLVAFDDQPGFTLVMHYDPTVEELSPPVKAPLQVLVPFDTPPDSTIFVATSASGWAQQPLEWSTVPFAAVGEVEVPRGEWFYYKYTRGDWETVEKWSGCLESANRYAFGKAHPVKEDVVEEWADLCP
jgi:alpha-glucosidase